MIQFITSTLVAHFVDGRRKKVCLIDAISVSEGNYSRVDYYADKI